MKINFDQLQAHLDKGPKAIYLLSSDDALLMQMATESLLSYFISKGYAKTNIQISTDADWSEIQNEKSSLSLFSQKKLLLVSFKSPGKSGAKVLTEYVTDIPDDTILILQSSKLDNRSLKAKWYNALMTNGVHIPLWPVRANELPKWTLNRAHAHGLTIESHAISLLCEATEGNLVSLENELKKLSLLYDDKPIDKSMVLSSVTNDCKFSVFDLTDAIIQSDAYKIIKILKTLEQTATEPLLVLWSLTSLARVFANLCSNPNAFVVRHFNPKIDSKRREVAKRSKITRWYYVIHQCHLLDKKLKGLGVSAPWQDLTSISLIMASTNRIAFLESAKNP